MKENEFRVLKVEPHEHPKERILENTLEAWQETFISVAVMQKEI